MSEISRWIAEHVLDLTSERLPPEDVVSNIAEDVRRELEAQSDRYTKTLLAAKLLLQHAERGAHYCRGQGCDAGTHNGWQHGQHCTSVAHDMAVDAVRAQIDAALADETSAERSEETGR